MCLREANMSKNMATELEGKKDERRCVLEIDYRGSRTLDLLHKNKRQIRWWDKV